MVNLYEDNEIIVVRKPAGIATQTARLTEKDLVSEIKGYIFETKHSAKEPYLGVVHRLDQPVEGILVFAKTPACADKLSKQLQTGKMEKHYLAVVSGIIEPGEHILTDYLVKDGRSNTSAVVNSSNKNAKLAKLVYEKMDESFLNDNPVTLVGIKLYTGRHHQIRVQMANAGHPILGDQKYGAREDIYKGWLNLCADELTFVHPITNQFMHFKITPENLFMKQRQDTGEKNEMS